MPAFSSAYSRLILRLHEIESILSMARAAAKEPPVPRNLARVGALCRGGVVLLSSHIEGYIEDLGTLAIGRIATKQVSKGAMNKAFRYYLSRDLITAIKESNNPATIASKVEDLFSRDAHIWDSDSYFSAPLPANIFVENFSNPRHDQIRRFFHRFGYMRFEGGLARRLTRDFSACKNMVDQVVDQRNKIAHGDMVTTGTPNDLEDMLRLVKMYCRGTDQVVCDWFRAVGCQIRS